MELILVLLPFALLFAGIALALFVWALAKQIGYAVWIYAALAVVMPVMSARWKRSVERAVADGARDTRTD